MRHIFPLLFFVIIASVKTHAQSSEVFLKLNRIVVLDSSNSLFSGADNNLQYLITVPPGVYWKLTKLTFGCNKPNYDGTENFVAMPLIYVKVNNSLISFEGKYGNQAEYIYNSANLPIWINPNSLIKIYSKQSYLSIPNSLITLYLNAEEYKIE